MLPVKKALGGDPEVIEARESLTKYKAKLSAAVTEAAAAAATRCVPHALFYNSPSPDVSVLVRSVASITLRTRRASG